MQTVCTTSIIAYERYDKPTGRAQCRYTSNAVLLRQGSDDILENTKKERLILIKQYFDFTPYVTDTPVSFTITDGPFTSFICDQLTVANIPFTVKDYNRQIQEDKVIADTDLALPPIETFDHAIITAPLAKEMTTRLETNSDILKLNMDNIMKNAYKKWYKADIEKDLQWD